MCLHWSEFGKNLFKYFLLFPTTYWIENDAHKSDEDFRAARDDYFSYWTLLVKVASSIKKKPWRLINDQRGLKNNLKNIFFAEIAYVHYCKCTSVSKSELTLEHNIADNVSFWNINNIFQRISLTLLLEI